MLKDQDLKTSVLLSTVIGLAALFLLLRYTTFLQIFGFEIVGLASGISTSFSSPILIITGFVVLCLWVVFSKRIKESSKTILESKKRLSLWIGGLSLVAFIGVSTGKFTYPLYTDEVRDITVANLVAENSLQLYVDNKGLEEIENEKDLEYLKWAQRLHPPGHYVLPSSLSSGDQSVTFYRFLYFLPTLLFAFFTFLLARVFRFSLKYYFALFILIFASTYLRNYSFIRVGNELFSFIGFSSFLIIVYHIYKGIFPINMLTCLLGMLCFLIGLYSKATSFVAMTALLAALFIGILLWRKKILLQLFGYCLAILFFSLIIYYITFENTAMLKLQIDSYKEIFRDVMPSISVGETVEVKVKSYKLEFLKNYFLLFVFGYGLINCLALGYCFYCISTKRFVFEELEILIVLFLLIGLLEVFLVYARTQYTAPFMLGLAFLLGRCAIKTLSPDVFIKMCLITFSFALSEVLLVSVA